MPETTPRHVGFRTLMGLAALAIVIAGLRALTPVIVPVVLAAVIAVCCIPALAWLQRHRVPGWAATLLLIVGSGAAVLALIALLGESVNRFNANIDDYVADWNARTHKPAQEWLQEHGVAVSIDAVRERFDPAAALEAVGYAVEALAGLLSNTFFVALAFAFILAELAGLPAKAREALAHPKGARDLSSRVVRALRDYVGMKTWLSLLTGVACGLLVWALGIDFPGLWGLAAFLLNYIPNIGSIVAAVPPLLLGVVQHGANPYAGWDRGLGVIVGYVIINMVVGNVLEPKVLGRRLGLSSLVVFISLVFWIWVWGPVGGLLAVPMTIVVKILLEETDDLRWAARLLGPVTEPVDAVEVTAPEGAGLERGTPCTSQGDPPN